ncbi:hypothetical protein [Yersinia sp. 2545 StPb PI]|uniref:hypothetical protein n=1 Tax=Yersinia sp. 2545 StPb PI TaxID=3117410 RepID=UPI003FA442E5
MSEIKQYDTEVRLEAVMGTNHYGVHIHAMTAEDLHSKSDIAVELAWRDLRIEQLIAQLEGAQKERDVYANLASDVGDIITLLQNNEWAEHIGKTNVGGLLEYQITRLMNSIADINTKLLAAETALSAANEMVPVTIDSGVIRDANRYRFLRDEDAWGEDSDSWDVETRTGLISSGNLMELRLDHFDAAIGARMAASDIPFLNPANASQKPVVLPRVAAIHAELTDVARHRTSVENIQDVVEAIKAAVGKVEGE